MRNPPRSRLSPPLACALAALALASGCGSPPPPSTVDIPAEYVAIGDSYTAVSGVSDEADGCLRSGDDYPGLVAKMQSFKGFVNASCAGATSANLTEPQTVQTTKYTNSAQLASITSKTKVVTVGIGMNNNGLSAFLVPLACATSAGGTEAKCDAAILSLSVTALHAAIQAMGISVRGNIESVRAKTPDAQIIFVGYPRLLPEHGRCPSQIPASQPALDRIRSTLAEANEVLRTTASDAGADFVDMYKASIGHDMCSTDPWVNGQNQTAAAYPFHPLTSYHRAVAAQIAVLLDH